MSSPFPGMDPYIEQNVPWGDFHGRFNSHAAEHLSAQLVPDYVVRVEEYVYAREPEEFRTLVGRADVAATDGGGSSARGAAVGVIEAPSEVELLGVGLDRVTHIVIRDREDNGLVAMVELLSPSNKYAGDDKNAYLAKRALVAESDAHFVEIDLLRGGPPIPLTRQADLCVFRTGEPRGAAADCRILAHRNSLNVAGDPGPDPGLRRSLGPQRGLSAGLRWVRISLSALQAPPQPGPLPRRHRLGRSHRRRPPLILGWGPRRPIGYDTT